MEEFITKLNRIRTALHEQNLFGCYIKRQDNFAWLTCGGINYVGPGDYGNCGLLVTEDHLYAITNNIEAPRMRDEEHLETLGFQIHHGLWYDRSFEKNEIEKLCNGKPIGSDLPGYAKDLTAVLRLLRASLTEEEIQRYITGGEKVSRIMEETAVSARPGETEWEVASIAASRAWEEGIEPLSVFCSSDERILQYRHAISSSKIIRDRMQLGCNMRYKGLIIGCTRFVNFKPVDGKLRKQYQDNTEISCRMIEHTISGEPYTAPLLAGKQAYETLGYKEEFAKHHQGGSIGYQMRDCRVDFDCTEIIADNQAFCWNPSITGTKSEDTIITTPEKLLFVTRPYLYPTIQVQTGTGTYIRADILEKY